MLDHETFDHFYSEGIVTRQLRPVKSGKEASVVLCEGGGCSPFPLVAIKEHARIEERTFRNDAIYNGGVVENLKARDRRALRSKTQYGKQVQEGVWLHREWEHLNQLHDAGCSVPEPIALGPRSIAMQFIGDVDQSAPVLQRVRLQGSRAHRAFEFLIAQLEQMLAINLVHGDLSAFNVLWWNETPVIIDVPQAVDPRLNKDAERILARDVVRLCDYFARQGVRSDPEEITHGLWMSFMFADL
ncbi:MAG: RIO1 family regulatory kinase/ATPase domain-containing protein [Actinomycetota bacterium]